MALLRSLLRLPVSLVLCALLLPPGLARAATPSIEVDLQAAFPSPPFLLELLETAAAENSSSYLPLLDTIAAGRFISTSSDQELYNLFLDVLKQDGHIKDPATLASWKLALAVHEAAPRIEAQYQYWRTAVQAQLSLVEDSTVEGSSHGLQVWRNGGRLCTDAVCEGTSSGYKAGHTTKTMQFDRLQGSGAISDMWTVYVDPTSADFPQAYQEWRRGHPGESTAFRLRLKPPHGAQTPLVVNGYGVELALKRTDYIVIDDREAEAVQKGISSSPADINLEADDDNQQLKPLTSSELLELGTKAASYVMSSNDPLDTLARVSRDFPKYASALAAYETSSAFVTEHKTNQLMVPAGMNVMWINGVQMNARDINAFTLLEHLRKERKLISGIEELGFSASESIALLSHEALTQVAAEGDVQRYDWRDATEGGKVIIWMNNLEKDKRYAAWPKTAQALLQRVYPGQLPQVAVDLQNIVLPIDITKRDDLVTIVDTLQNLVKRQISARFGIVPITASPLAAEHAKVMYYLCDTYGLSAVMAYLETVAAGRKISAVNQETFTTAIANRKLRTNKTELSLEEVLESATYKTSVDSAKSYLARLGADKPNAPYFANGAPIPSTDDWLQTMSNRISTDLRMVQMAIFEQRITDDDWLPSVFLETASFKRNPLIVPEDEASVKILDMGKLFRDFPEEMAGLELDHDLDDTNGEKASLAIILDLNTYEGAETAIASYEFSQAHPDVDIMVRHTSGDGGITDASVEAAKFVLAKDRAGMDDYLKSRLAQSGASAESEQMSELATAMGLEEGDRGLMITGRVVKIPAGSEFTTTDFADLLAYERQKRIAPVLTALKALVLQDNIKSSADLARLTSLVALSSTNDVPEGIYDSTPGLRINIIPKWQDVFTCIKKGDREAAQLQVVALLDPVSEVAQQWVPIMKVLSELDGVHLRIYLNPQENLSELPIKRFFRQVLRSEPLFDDAGKLAGQSARFSGVPQEALLTVTMHTPPSWLVAPKVSVHDLDNIKLSALKGTTSVTATYELEHILIEGHSRDVTNGNAPRGVQLALSTENDAAFEGTIIMANLGYFQFKVNPGVYNLALQRGRSTEIFNLDSAGILGETGQNSTDISLLSFQGSTLFPRLSRKPGKRTEDVLEPSALSADNILAKGAEIADDILAKTGLSNTKAGEYIAAGLTFGQKLLTKAGMNSGLIPIGRHHEKHADINIFSVASGHLYERMLNIMMVSVTRHTKHTVKFWFIEQFLSPSFKQFLPHMAAHYNFRYEMVTYAWPHWLRAQKEKQRVIWGYKILFLDVLFPLDLDKVIFVDADQIVRTDMYELVTHDLEGAPYGFTPMCDSRTEMEGYRFWKQGYWKNFLRGSPYHISALYVVDLKRFRQIAAGDRLRQQYHQLSADPASLSNLDQDLPNHMQHALPIHSLPQEWLWCETWCSDESLKQARTIDLCNNPQTKEPKLDRARRQVPEWTVYDDEIAEVARAVREREGGVEEAGAVPLAGGVQEDEVQGAGERVVKAQESGAMPAGNAVADGEEQQVKDEL